MDRRLRVRRWSRPSGVEGDQPVADWLVDDMKMGSRADRQDDWKPPYNAGQCGRP